MTEDAQNPDAKAIFAFHDLAANLMPKEIEMLDALFEYATEGIIICEKNGHIRMANPRAERMFGYETGELRGRPIEDLLPMRYRSHHEQYREGYVKKPTTRTMGTGRDLYGMRKDGSEIMVEVSLSPFKTSHGEYIMSFIVDSTERKKNEIEL